MFNLASPTGYEPYAVSLLGLWLALGAGAKLRERSVERRRRKAAEAGATEPVSLHPVIHPEKCVGCGACTHACPEGKIIGMINGKAELIDPASCIGHGACKTACPAGAIDLVFGTARRGVDIPIVSPRFESSVPGIFIAGELGGMGLIANAIEQGRRAIEAVAERGQTDRTDYYDVIIVGGGPAGIAASLAAKQKGLSYLTLEQHTLGGTIARYPRGKLVMTRPARLPLYGRVRFRRVRKERLLGLWQAVMAKTGIEITEGVRVERIMPAAGGFEVMTSSGLAKAGAVLLATGRRGAPRRLAIPGEDLAKVAYALDDPARYRGLHVLVVGGGDSALETVIALLRTTVASVTLVHRGNDFNRAKSANRDRLADLETHGRLVVLRNTRVHSIEPGHVVIDDGRQRFAIANQAVIACTGGVLPTELLAEAGVSVERKFGQA